jgi:hypothetical protein
LSGLQEILVLVLIVIVLFFLPRMVSRPAQQAPKPPVQIKQIPGKWRLALFVSAVWLVIAALWLKPWGGNLALFTCVGALPVLIFWGVVWVRGGYTRRKP